MLTVPKKKSGLSALERFCLELLILEDKKIGKWFTDVCTGTKPTVKVPEETLVVLQGAGFVRKSACGWVLRSDGRQFARDLGLIPGPAAVEEEPPSAVMTRIRADRNPRTLPQVLERGGIGQVWREYRATGSVELRNQLIENCLPLVRYNAERVWAKLPNEVDLDDLISSGTLGLIDAIEAFDIDRGVKFSTYCSQRISGAILDELRERDWVPRLVRNRLSDADSHKYLRGFEALGDKKFDESFMGMQKKEVKSLIMRGLSRAERLIVLLYYYEEMTMKEIGKMLDLSESRVSQMHSAIVKRLKQHLLDRRSKFDRSVPEMGDDEEKGQR